MTEAVDDYRLALASLVARGAKITNDSVSLEAGRKKGSIKSGRAEFLDLVKEIRSAAQKQLSSQGLSAPASNSQAPELQRKLDASLAREVALLREIRSLRRHISKMTGENVVPIRRSEE